MASHLIVIIEGDGFFAGEIGENGGGGDVGGISDRWGRRPVIVIGALGVALGFLIFGLGGFLASSSASSLGGSAIWLLLLGRIIQGITAGDMPVLVAYVADITPAAQRAKRYGMLGTLSGIGFMIGPAIGGLLAAHSVDLPVVVTAGVALTVGVRYGIGAAVPYWIAVALLGAAAVVLSRAAIDSPSRVRVVSGGTADSGAQTPTGSGGTGKSVGVAAELVATLAEPAS